MGKILMQGTGGGEDLDLVTAKASDILQGKVIIGPDGEPLTGTIPILSARAITPGTGNQVINAGNYLGGNITVVGDPDLIAANIKAGKNIFNVAGVCKEFLTKTMVTNGEAGGITSFEYVDGGTVSLPCFWFNTSMFTHIEVIAAISKDSSPSTIYWSGIGGCHISGKSRYIKPKNLISARAYLPVSEGSPQKYDIVVVGY